MDTTQTPATWAEYDQTLSGIASEMIGAGNFFDKNPEAATDEAVAATFHRYVKRLRDVARPA